MANLVLGLIAQEAENPSRRGQALPRPSKAIISHSVSYVCLLLFYIFPYGTLFMDSKVCVSDSVQLWKCHRVWQKGSHKFLKEQWMARASRHWHPQLDINRAYSSWVSQIRSKLSRVGVHNTNTEFPKALSLGTAGLNIHQLWLVHGGSFKRWWLGDGLINISDFFSPLLFS